MLFIAICGWENRNISMLLAEFNLFLKVPRSYRAMWMIDIFVLPFRCYRRPFADLEMWILNVEPRSCPCLLILEYVVYTL